MEILTKRQTETEIKKILNKQLETTYKYLNEFRDELKKQKLRLIDIERMYNKK